MADVMLTEDETLELIEALRGRHTSLSMMLTRRLARSRKVAAKVAREFALPTADQVGEEIARRARRI